MVSLGLVPGFMVHEGKIWSSKFRTVLSFESTAIQMLRIAKKDKRGC
jgi:hypothetical protein